MSEPRLLDTTGRRRSPAATPGHRAGCSPANKGMRYPADPPRIEEIIAVMRQAGSGTHADRVRALIAILWRAGLRISEALALTESDLDPRSGSVLIRAGKGGKRRMVGMDDWAWERQHLDRATHPVARRPAVLHFGPSDPRASVVSNRSPRHPARARSSRRGPPTLRAASAPSRPRG